MFQRARSEQQREIRRQAILDTTAGMLEEMSVGEISLNELSRRVGLAKSNVLRYFETREAILLELLDRALKQWMDELSQQLAIEISPGGTVRERGDQLAAVFARSLASHRVLCDLLSAQAGVLEHNVSVEVATRYKRAILDNFAALVALVRTHLPELDDGTGTVRGLDDGAGKVCGAAIVMVGAIWTHSQPSASCLAAYEADPSLAVMRLDFTTAVEETLATLIAGRLARTM
jgi:AcrR family transcriptional regulator